MCPLAFGQSFFFVRWRRQADSDFPTDVPQQVGPVAAGTPLSSLYFFIKLRCFSWRSAPVWETQGRGGCLALRWFERAYGDA